MLAVVTPEEMAAIDASAREPVGVLIERAGFAAARAARSLMGGTYGRRVVVVNGQGNNGRDGLVAARLLAAGGARVASFEAAHVPSRLEHVDLVIDAAFGTGFRGSYTFPETSATVLAVDIPSGLDGLTGVAGGRPAEATSTITFAALKPGLLIGDGPQFAGSIEVADIGLDVSGTNTWLVQDADVTAWFPERATDAHKWRSALWIVGGSPNMTGAPRLAAAAALAAGAGYVRLSSPSAALDGAPVECVTVSLPPVGWARAMLSNLDRIAAAVVGPGLGRDESTRAEVCEVATAADLPLVIDGDGLWAVAELRGRMHESPRVLTPHDGEYTQLAGHPPGADRVAAARRLAAERSCVVVLKGPTTIIADARGRVRMVVSGDERLASAGTGDVLSGMIGAMLAAGADPFDAAAAAAHVHGLAGRRLPPVGASASLLPSEVSGVLSTLTSARPRPSIEAQ